ncbi:uncharacterized protein LOC143849349 [Tasmannia lanceolata]|uniref:uncharacterized protein LOC143849349 n=1 Tax=Tasmannia lanceolata TaxID=3420 RepID=UPI0040636CD8
MIDFRPKVIISNILSSHRTKLSLASAHTLSQIHNSNGWNLVLSKPSLTEEFSTLKEAIFNSENLNIPIWKPSTSGHFSTKSAWNAVRTIQPKPPWHDSIWFPGHIPRHSVVAWKAIQDKLLTKDNLLRFIPSIDTQCLLCCAENESVNHLFFSCSYSAWIWRSILWWFGTRRRPKKELKEEEQWAQENFRGKGQIPTALKLCFTSSIYHIWGERNNKVFENSKSQKSVVLDRIVSEVRIKINCLGISDLPSKVNHQIADNMGFIFKAKSFALRLCFWNLPSENEIKVNVDASLEESGGGIGGLLRRHDGSCIAMFSKLTDREEIFALEILAVENGVKLATTLGTQHLWIESDSLFAVKSVARETKYPWKQTNRIRAIRAALDGFISWKISHSWREANAATDILSKRSFPIKGDNISLAHINEDLLRVLEQDKNGYLYTRL